MEIKQFKPSSHKIKALIYWPSGVGKTTFGGTAKDVLFASAENWLLSVADKNVSFVEIKTLSDLQGLNNYLRTKEHNFKTLVIDSITEISDLIKSGIEKRTGRQMQIQDWGQLGSDIEKIIKEIKDIDINVIVIAQEMIEKDSDKVQRIVPSLYGKSATKISYYMDIVGYLYVDKNGKRTIITNPGEKLVTKDRTNKIGNDETVDFEKWVELVSNIEVGESKVTEKILTPEEELAEQREMMLETYTKSIEDCKNMKDLKEIFGAITLDKDDLGTKYYKKLSASKDNKKQELENAEAEK